MNSISDILRPSSRLNIHKMTHLLFKCTLEGYIILTKYQSLKLLILKYTNVGEEFYMPDLNYPLRNTPAIVKYAYFERENLPMPQSDEVAVAVTSAPYSTQSPKRTNVQSKIIVPQDLCEGGNVDIIKDDDRLRNLETEVLKSVEFETQVLIVVLDNTEKLFKLLQEKMVDNFITYRGWGKGSDKSENENGNEDGNGNENGNEKGTSIFRKLLRPILRSKTSAAKAEGQRRNIFSRFLRPSSVNPSKASFRPSSVKPSKVST